MLPRTKILLIFALIFILFHGTSSFILNRNVSSFGYHMRIGVKRAEFVQLAESNVKRIVGGTQAQLGQFAFQAGLIITLTTGWPSLCGGSLVSKTRVITAAHCWYDGVNQAKSLLVVLGSVTLYSGGTRIESRDIVVHPNWNPQDVLYDIAIVKIPAVDYSNNIQAIPMPTLAEVNVDFSGLQGTVSGFGKTSDASHINFQTSSLHHIDVPIITKNECQKSFDFPLHGSHVCTKGGKGKGTCDGDSGGPLSVLWNMKRVLVGVTSFGLQSGCEKGYPSVYTRITTLLPWIQSNM